MPFNQWPARRWLRCLGVVAKKVTLRQVLSAGIGPGRPSASRCLRRRVNRFGIFYQFWHRLRRGGLHGQAEVHELFGRCLVACRGRSFLSKRFRGFEAAEQTEAFLKEMGHYQRSGEGATGRG
jgi:hypothetical protein